MKRITSLIIILLIDFRSHSSPTGCQNDEWQCKDGACISESARCDNFPDCMDNSDEENCSRPPVCLEGLESCPQPNGTTVCVEKAVGCSCGPIKEIDNGKIESDSITIGSEAAVVCNAGYDATLPTVKCQVTGLWETASCLPKDCGAPANIAFGKVTLSDINKTKYGANAYVECNVGFETLTPVIKCDETGSWETAVCTAKDCGPVAKISFGKVILSDIDNTTYGANADVVCDVGFDTITPVIKCDETGSWGTAVCTAKDCGAPSKITFGKVTLSDINNTAYGANANVECDVGFETITPVIKCDETGSWETALCTSKDCGAPGNIAYGKVVLNDINNTTYGANADVECNVGFETLTPVIKCDETGRWGTAVCTAKDCGSTPSISFGRITLSDDTNSTFGATATVTCNTGYLENKQSIICQSSGVWEDATCLPRDCGPVQSIAFGTIVLADSNNTTFGASALVICDAGYESKTTEVFCLKTGLWERAECTIRGCGLVPEISHGTIKTPANDSVGSYASVVCDKGYEANVSSVFCKISGQWESASCTIKDCGHTPAIPFGQITPNNRNITTYGASANVTCYTGYTSNVSKVYCLSTGVWERSACKPIDCGPPPLIKHGNTFLGNYNKTTYGATAFVSCQFNYVATRSVIKCQSSGTWENAACVFKGCGSLPEISHGTIKAPANVSIGSFANVTCDTGYEANVSSVMCKWSGLWETASCKAKDCGRTPWIPFGQSRLINYRNTSYGASARVTCYGGYESNVSTILCQSTGVWQTAVCRPKEGCGPVPTILHGRIISTGNTSAGSTAIVTCDEGYTSNVSSVMCKRSGLWEQANCSATNSGSLRCYKCSMECSNDVCNERTVVCPRYKQSCQAIIQWNHGYYTLKKGCKRPSANTANGRSKCRRIGYKIVCSYECNGNLCNWELPEIHSYG